MTSSLAARWRDLLRSIGTTVLIGALQALTPVPASRPRVSRWGTYYAKTYKDWMARAGALLGATKAAAFNEPCVVFIEARLPKPKTSKFDTPSGDIDNYVKGPLDVITKAGVAWGDDRQVVGLIAFKRFAEPGEEPGTHIEYLKLEGAP